MNRTDNRRNELIEKNARLVYSAAWKHAKRSGLDVDDLIAAGNIGLVHAADKFNPNAGVKFSTYATLAVLRQIEKETDYWKTGRVGGLRGRWEPLQTVSSDTPGNDGTLTLGDTLRATGPGTEAEALARAENDALLAIAGRVLSDKPKEAEFVALHLEGMNEPEIARRTGASRQSVNNGLKRAWDRIRAALAEPTEPDGRQRGAAPERLPA